MFGFKKLKRKRSDKKLDSLKLESVERLLEPYGKAFRVKVTEVIDGDTIEIVWLHRSKVPTRIRVRVNGVDTPETRTKDIREKQAGLKVKELVEEWIGTNQTEAIFYDWDKFGFRMVGDLLIHGMLLSEFLLNNCYAHSYNGKTKKTPFTEDELEYIIESGSFV